MTNHPYGGIISTPNVETTVTPNQVSGPFALRHLGSSATEDDVDPLAKDVVKKFHVAVGMLDERSSEGYVLLHLLSPDVDALARATDYLRERLAELEEGTDVADR